MRIFLLIFALNFLTNCAVNPVTGKQDFVVISENQEIQMGREYNARYSDRIQFIKIKNYKIMCKPLANLLLLKATDLISYRFTILDSPDINAFALPGGYIYINRGLMSYLSSEEELAAVLGHEIGHVTARHSVRQYSQSQLLGILSTAIESLGVQQET